MPTSACCSAITSGVAISVDLQLDHAVPDRHREGVHRHVRRQVQGLSGPQVEHRAVARALDDAAVGVDVALEEVAVVVRAAVLDGDDVAVAVDDADLEVLPLDATRGARGELGNGADVDDGTQIRLSRSVLKSSGRGRVPA